MDVEGYRAALRGSPMKRVKLPAMKRNAAVVLGKDGALEVAPVLRQTLHDPQPLMREHGARVLRAGSVALATRSRGASWRGRSR